METIMNKIILVLPAFIPMLSGCNNSPHTTVPQPLPQITKCPSGGGEENEYRPLDQKDLLASIKAGKNQEAFLEAFDQGDLIFGTHFTSDQGGGAFIGGSEKSHYSRIPRADLKNPKEWGDPKRKVKRPTGPNAQSCVSCHSQPSEDGAGPTAANVHRDHHFTGNPELMIQRNTPHVFGAGALQRLAEEMTDELYAIKEMAEKDACTTKNKVYKELMAKGVNYGHITMTCESGTATLDVENSKIEGLAPDWMIRPYEWKKSVAFLRDFMRHAGNNEIGMQGVELVGHNVDEDNDGISNELSVGDMTAFTVYMAAQPRPSTKVELDDLGILTGDQHLTTTEREQIRHGDQLFHQIGCTACHKPELTLNDSVYKEPSSKKYEANPGHFVAYHDLKEDFFKEENVQVNMEEEGVLLTNPVKFDLAHDQPQNQLCKGKEKINLGAFETKAGKTIVRLYGDLKRHWMGDGLAEPIDELEKSGAYDGNPNMSLNYYEPVNAVMDPKYSATQSDRGKSTFGTKELWGVACTGPWLHDGRATTLTEAIQLHGGETESVHSRDQFEALTSKDQKDVIAFLGNLVLYLNTADPGKTPDGLSSDCEVKN
jgi:cytochrome c551/c552